MSMSQYLVLEGEFGEFRLLGFKFRALGVDHEPRGSISVTYASSLLP